MTARGASPLRTRTARRLAAWLGVVALFVQALLPAAALASDAAGRGPQIVVCSVDGVHTITLGGGGETRKRFAGLPCHDCLAAAAAALPAPEAAMLPVRYAAARVEVAAARRPTPQLARPPPRPPGQGPPQA
jgi:hypothetical protein